MGSMLKLSSVLNVILSRLAFLADCPFSLPTKMFLPTYALVHFIQQARENQNEAAESLPGVIGSL
jgi:hypothetical protein